MFGGVPSRRFHTVKVSTSPMRFVIIQQHRPVPKKIQIHKMFAVKRLKSRTYVTVLVTVLKPGELTNSKNNLLMSCEIVIDFVNDARQQKTDEIN